jgi:hypothetical protein
MIADFIIRIVCVFENDKFKLEKIFTEIDNFRKVENSDFEMLIEPLLNLLGIHSKTLTVLRCLSQNIIFIGCYHLAAALPNLPLTKDTEVMILFFCGEWVVVG